jgi:acyl dehydratase
MNTQPVSPDFTMTAGSVVLKSFHEIQPGDCAVLEKEISREAIWEFAMLCGDFNPLHVDERFAGQTAFARPVAHGMLLGSYVSTLIGMQLPGPGALWTEQSFRWLLPVFSGDVVRVALRVVHKSPATRMLKVAMEAHNQHGQKVMEGAGLVMMARMEAQPGAAD